MKEITASVTGQNLVLDQTVLNVAGSVNLYKLKITFDEDWADADTKIVSFSNGCGKAIAVDYNAEDGVTIPWEVLKTPEGQIGKVHIGVLGYAGTTLRITTTSAYEANVLIVMPAILGLEAAMTPTPDIYQNLLQAIAAVDAKIGQLSNLDTDNKTNIVAAINEVLSKLAESTTELQEEIGDLSQLDTEAKDNLVSAINELAAGGGGGGTVKSVNGIGPDEEGNVQLTPGAIGAQPTITITGTTLNI